MLNIDKLRYYFNKSKEDFIIDLFTKCKKTKINEEIAMSYNNETYFFLNESVLECSKELIFDVYKKDYGMTYLEIKELIANIMLTHFKLKHFYILQFI